MIWLVEQRFVIINCNIKSIWGQRRSHREHYFQSQAGFQMYTLSLSHFIQKVQLWRDKMVQICLNFTEESGEQVTIPEGFVLRISDNDQTTIKH